MADKIEKKLKRWKNELTENSSFKNVRQDFILFDERTFNLLRKTREVLSKKHGISGGKRIVIGIACLALLETIDTDKKKEEGVLLQDSSQSGVKSKER